MDTLLGELGVEAVDVPLHEVGQALGLVAESGIGVGMQAELAIGEVAVEVGVVVAGTEPLRPFTAHLDHLVDERACPVLGEGVPLPEAEAAPIVGDDVRHPELGAGDRGPVARVVHSGGRRDRGWVRRRHGGGGRRGRGRHGGGCAVVVAGAGRDHHRHPEQAGDPSPPCGRR